MSKKSYERLEEKIERYERRKGYSRTKASYIAHAAAGKVAREKRAKRTRRNPGLLFGLSLAQLALIGGGAALAWPTIKQQLAAQRAQQQAGHPSSGALVGGTAFPGRTGGVVGNVGV